MPSVMPSDYAHQNHHEPMRPRAHPHPQNGYPGPGDYDPYRDRRDPYFDPAPRSNIHRDSTMNRDAERGQIDMFRGQEDPYRRHNDYHGREDPYRSTGPPGHPFRGPADSYRPPDRGSDTYNDPFRGHPDPYRHDDPYRAQDSYRSGISRDDLYSKVHRGVNGHGPYAESERTITVGDGFRDSREKPTEPLFEVDHLATFIATKRGAPGLVTVEEGISKLRSMELMTGIWTMRCHMVIERQHIVILDNQTGEEQDRFPIELVHNPTAIVRNDPREIYNNLLLFTAVTDPKKGDPEPNMHIFQSVSASSQAIADEIQAAKDGKSRVHSGHQIPPPPSKPAPQPPPSSRVQEQVHNFQRMMSSALTEHKPVPGMYGRNRPLVKDRDDNDSIHSEKIEMDMRKLNACCDDIEKFVARLQQAAEAYRALEKREVERRKKDPKNRQKQVGDGMLTMRARPPPTNDYTEIFQKFKYAFNILACLKPYIHDPNAPELVHFLFTPLSLICEASRDPRNGAPNIASSAIAPLLTKEGKELLLNCLTTKEQQFWMSLGDSWYLTKDQYRGYVPPYSPRFSNGWQPAMSEAEDESRNISNAIDTSNDFNNYVPQTSHEEIAVKTYNEGRQETAYNNNNNFTTAQQQSVYPTETMNYQQNQNQDGSIPSSQPSPRPANNHQMRSEANLAFARELQMRGARLVQVEHSRQGKNVKELSVEGGDILEVLESARNWWRLRNCYGEIGHAPYTILKEIRPEDVETKRLTAGLSAMSTNDTTTQGTPLATSSQIHRSTLPDANEEGPTYAVVGKKVRRQQNDVASTSQQSSVSTNFIETRVLTMDAQPAVVRPMDIPPPITNIVYTSDAYIEASQSPYSNNSTTPTMQTKFPRPKVSPNVKQSEEMPRPPRAPSVSSSVSDEVGEITKNILKQSVVTDSKPLVEVPTSNGIENKTPAYVPQSNDVDSKMLVVSQGNDTTDMRASSPVLKRVQMLNDMAAKSEQKPEIKHTTTTKRGNSFGKCDVIRNPDYSPVPSDASSPQFFQSDPKKRASYIQAEIVHTKSFQKRPDSENIQITIQNPRPQTNEILVNPNPYNARPPSDGEIIPTKTFLHRTRPASDTQPIPPVFSTFQKTRPVSDVVPVQPIFDLLHRGQLDLPDGQGQVRRINIPEDQGHRRIRVASGGHQRTSDGQGERLFEQQGQSQQHMAGQGQDSQGYRITEGRSYQQGQHHLSDHGQGQPITGGQGQPITGGQGQPITGGQSQSKTSQGQSITVGQAQSITGQGHNISATEGQGRHINVPKGQRQQTRSPVPLRPKVHPVAPVEVPPQNRESGESDPRHSSSLQDELKARMKDTTTFSNRPRSTSQNNVNITDHSLPMEVRQWLMHKGFSPRCVDILGNVPGDVLFRLQRSDLDRLLRGEDVSRLESQLTIQKSLCGFGSDVSVELKHALARRKHTVDDVELSSVSSDDVFTSTTSVQSQETVIHATSIREVQLGRGQTSLGPDALPITHV